MSEHSVRPSRFVMPPGEHRPRQAYRRPGSDLSRVPSQMEQAMSKREGQSPHRWENLPPKERQEHIVNLLEHHGGMTRGKLGALLRVSYPSSGYNALTTDLKALRRAGRVEHHGNEWRLPRPAPASAADEAAGADELAREAAEAEQQAIREATQPRPGESREPAAEPGAPSGSREDEAKRWAKRWVEEYYHQSDRAEGALVGGTHAIAARRYGITSDGELLLWLPGEGYGPVALSAETTRGLYRMLARNHQFLADPAAETPREAGE